MGQVLQAGAGQAPARQAAIGAGIPKEIGADTVNKVCASSIRAIQIADVMIRAGEHDVVVTGGMESMSNAPYLLQKARFGYRFGNGELIDAMIYDGLTCTFDGLLMVQQNSVVARELGISREEQDAWAVRSQERAAAAQDGGTVRRGDRPGRRRRRRRGDPRRHHAREARGARSRCSIRKGRPPPATRPGVNDGASCVVVTSEAFANDAGPRDPGARSSRRPTSPTTSRTLPRTPAGAGALALEKAGRTIADVKRVEINEAFASVAANSTRHARGRPGDS